MNPHRVDVPRWTWLILLAIVGTMACMLPSGALGFGTAAGINGMASDHESITRAALSCGAGQNGRFRGIPDPVPNCFGPKSIDNLAGFGSFAKGCGTIVDRCGVHYVGSGFGAVGASDNMAMRVGLSSPGGPDWWHCDNGDYLDQTNYPQSVEQSRTALMWCQNFGQAMLTQGLTGNMATWCGGALRWRAPCFGAVKAANYLLNTSNNVNTGMDLQTPCAFAGGDWISKPYAKCTVLEPFGYLLHVAMDFYAHTNYGDTASPGAATLTNPPGLENTTLPNFWNQSGNVTDLWDNTLFPNQPNGIWPVSGCYNGIVSADGGTCVGRVTHTAITKDLTGGVRWWLGGAATIVKSGSPRGQIANNEQQAVTLAIREVRRQWQRLQDNLIATYGVERGTKMICAMIKDDPAKECN
ncbi:MAG: hypothetical protein ACOYL4_07885 [Miltoncostaeaceae bacterium]